MKADFTRAEEIGDSCNPLGAPADKRCDSGSKGKILRVKEGYNPNSSSMGSIVFVLPAALLGITAGFGVISGIIVSAFMKHTSQNDSEGKEPTGQEEQ